MSSVEETSQDKQLSDRHKGFVEAYLRTWNATSAADEMGYAQPYSQGHRLLKNVEIKAEISRRLTEMTMSADEVLARLSEQATVSIADFWRIEDNSVISVSPDKIKLHGHLVKKMKVEPDKIELELHDGQTALIQLGRHHKLFTDKTEITGEDGGALKLEIFNRSLDRVYGDRTDG